MRMPFPLKAPPQICVSIRGSKTAPATLAFIRGNPCSSVAKKPPPPPSVARLCVCAARGHARCRGHTTLERLHRNARKLPGDTPPFRGTHAAWGHARCLGTHHFECARCLGTHHFEWGIHCPGVARGQALPGDTPLWTDFTDCPLAFIRVHQRCKKTTPDPPRKTDIQESLCVSLRGFAASRESNSPQRPTARHRLPGDTPLSRSGVARGHTTLDRFHGLPAGEHSRSSAVQKTTPDPARTTDIQEPLCVYP